MIERPKTANYFIYMCECTGGLATRTREKEGGWREELHGLVDWKCGRKGGCVGMESEQSRVQLSFWQERSTEGFIVICNYVVFCGASVWCAPTLRLFLAGEYWVGEQREGGTRVTANYSCWTKHEQTCRELYGIWRIELKPRNNQD